MPDAEPIQSQEKKRSEPSKDATKKIYEKPRVDWEQKMEPSAHAATCGLEAGQGPLCDASPTA